MNTLETFIGKEMLVNGERRYIPYFKDEVTCLGVVVFRDMDIITLSMIGYDRDSGNVPYEKFTLENAQWIIDKYLEQLRQKEGRQVAGTEIIKYP